MFPGKEGKSPSLGSISQEETKLLKFRVRFVQAPDRYRPGFIFLSFYLYLPLKTVKYSNCREFQANI